MSSPGEGNKNIANKVRMQEDRLNEIERENKMLLDKMAKLINSGKKKKKDTS